MTTYIGIDIGKDTLVVAYPKEKSGHRTQKFANNPTGCRQLIKSLPLESHCILEATGCYGLTLIYCLTNSQIKMSLLNPKQSSNFAKVLMLTVKTDERDAMTLSIYGERMKPNQYIMPDDKIMQYKQFRMVLRQFKKQHSALHNVQHALKFHPKPDPTVEQSLQKMLDTLKEEITKIETKITQISQDEYGEILALITSIKGIGNKTASALIVATNGLKNFDSAKKLTKFIGTVPIIKKSGTSIDIKGSISRSGDPEVRSLLYMAACSASRFNTACKETYQRLRANGKKPKVALVAVMNKLLRQIYAVVKNNTMFENNYKLVKNIA
jgi:transposase